MGHGDRAGTSVCLDESGRRAPHLI